MDNRTERKQDTVLSVRVRPQLRAMLEHRADALGLRPCDLYRSILAAAATPDAGLPQLTATKQED